MMSSYVKWDAHACSWQVETVMGILDITVWEIFITPLFWNTSSSDNLKVDFLCLFLQILQKLKESFHSDVLH